MEPEVNDMILLLCEMLRKHEYVTFTLPGVGETQYTTRSFSSVVEELEEKYGSK